MKEKEGRPSESTDEQLMEAYRQGDFEAFEVLYQRHSGKVYGFLRNRLSARTLTDDVFQGTFLKLHQCRKQYDASLPFLPWLFTICRSVMIDALRKTQRSLEVSVEEPTTLENVESSTSSSLAQLEAKASSELAGSITGFQKLPAKQQEVLELRYTQELSFEEIASRLNTSPINVRQMVSRAIKKLKQVMDGQGSSAKRSEE